MKSPSRVWDGSPNVLLQPFRQIRQGAKRYLTGLSAYSSCLKNIIVAMWTTSVDNPVDKS